MNQRKAKSIRRLAEQAMFDWYKSLLSEEDGEHLTIKLVKEYTPYVQYFKEEVEVEYKGKTYTQNIIHVSDHTQRWFYKQEKQRYGTRQYTLTSL